MILSVGELLVDVITLQPADVPATATRFEARPGGSPANFAFGCKKLSADARLVATVGNDGFATMLLQHLEQNGIGTDHIHCSDQYATSLIVIVNKGQTPDFIPYRNADYYIEPVSDALIDECRLLHTTSFALSKPPAQYRILDAMQKAFAKGKLVSIDWNYSSKIWGTDNDAHAVFEQVMQYKPLVKLSLDDVDRFWGAGTGIQDAMNRVNIYDTTAACITCGAEGVWFRHADGSWQHRAAQPIKVTDPTGAGDSFWSGFITSYLNDLSIDECISVAMNTASLKLQQKL